MFDEDWDKVTITRMFPHWQWEIKVFKTFFCVNFLGNNDGSGLLGWLVSMDGYKMGLFGLGGGMHSFKSRIDMDVPELAVFIIHSKTIYRIASGLSFRSVLLKTEWRELFIEQVVIRKPEWINLHQLNKYKYSLQVRNGCNLLGWYHRALSVPDTHFSQEFAQLSSNSKGKLNLEDHVISQIQCKSLNIQWGHHAPSML